jgi:hypothetical protein
MPSFRNLRLLLDLTLSGEALQHIMFCPALSISHASVRLFCPSILDRLVKRGSETLNASGVTLNTDTTRLYEATETSPSCIASCVTGCGQSRRRWDEAGRGEQASNMLCFM